MRATSFFGTASAVGLFALNGWSQPAVAPAEPRLPAQNAAAASAPASAPNPGTPKVDEAAQVLAPEPNGLTARVVAERSSASSNTVRMRLAELDVARARLDQTTAQFLPKLTLRASYTRLSPVSSSFSEGGALVATRNAGPLSGVGACPPGTTTPNGQCVLDSEGEAVIATELSIPSVQNNYALTASLNVPISDYILRLSNATAGASASERAAELALKAERLKVRADAQAIFYDWLRTRARVVIEEKSLERVRARLKDARPAYEIGTITKADVMRLEALAASSEQRVLEAKTYQSLSELSLAIVMGERSGARLHNGEDVSTPLPVQRRNLEAMTRDALATRLELRALDEASRATRHAAKAVNVGAWPRLDAFGEVMYANPNQRYFPPASEWNATWSVGAAATWTVGDVFANGASSRELDASSRSLDAQRAAISDGVRQEVAAQYLARAKADGALEAARRGLASAEEAYRVATDLYQVGKATTTELIEAEGDLVAARLNELNARIEQRIAEARIEHAVGRDIQR